MVRVVMSPEARRKEIINVALELFDKRGYEQTAISDIVNKANVAQGTFYYYFKSKDEIMDAIIEQWIAEVEKNLDALIQNSHMNALQKSFDLILQVREISLQYRGFLNYVHEKRNEILHFRFMRKAELTVAPYLEKVIHQGTEEGVFHTQYPKEAAMAFLAISDFLSHELKSTQEEANTRLINAVLEFTELILGVKRGTFFKMYTSWKRDTQKQAEKLLNEPKKAIKVRK